MPIAHISFQKSPHHLVSLSDMTCHRILNLEVTCLKNSLAASTSVTFVVLGTMKAYLLSLSIITSILSNPFEVGNSSMSPMLMTLKGCDGIGSL